MSVGKSAWMLSLAMMWIAGLAMAAEIEQPAAAPKVETNVEMEKTEAPRLAAESLCEAKDEDSKVSYAKTGTGPQGFKCSCECTCPASGAFEVQMFTLPAWTNRSCESFDGDACSISTPDTCNTPRSYANCVTL